MDACDENEVPSRKESPPGPSGNGLPRILIASHSEEDHDPVDIGSRSSPCRCTLPQKPSVRGPGKGVDRQLGETEGAVAATTQQRKNFHARKNTLARGLLCELDSHVADSELAKLTAGTGGVRIVWSTTLRSTVGRAKLRRAPSRISRVPIKREEAERAGVEIAYFLTIELAERIVDSEDRLVSTLAHEFCHLANFLISNVRDRPHGAGFKRWAAKVTAHLRKSDVEMWRKVEVTTKHHYAIDRKYKRVSGGQQQKKTKEASATRKPRLRGRRRGT